MQFYGQVVLKMNCPEVWIQFEPILFFLFLSPTHNLNIIIVIIIIINIIIIIYSAKIQDNNVHKNTVLYYK